MTSDWRTLGPQALEAQFNPRVTVADAAEWIDAFARAGESARAAVGAGEALRYGEAAEAWLSLYRPSAPSPTPTPLVLAIHGGYWRALSREYMDFLVPPLLQAGIAVATVDYTLCPAAPLDTLVDQMRAATRWLSERAPRYGIDAQRLWLLGHSAGAHLAAKVLYDDARVLHGDAGSEGEASAVRGAVLISGLYDLEPVVRVSVNAAIGLDEAGARRNSVRVGPTTKRALTQLVAVGDQETPMWIEQSRSLHKQALAAGVDSHWLSLPGHHFSCLMSLNDPMHGFTRAVIGAVLEDRYSGGERGGARG
ncbi:MAG: alpha/beta hydrolase [Burkholderiaceae bacterium]|jgi:arylformamidase|nr:alpha/beta hydrolase [Burkholderiaceae bacterium]